MEKGKGKDFSASEETMRATRFGKALHCGQ